jgi:hypothetical protein
MGPVSAQTGTSRLAPGLPLSAGSGRLLDGAGTERFDYSFRHSARRYEIETLQRSDVPECQFRKVHDMLFQPFVTTKDGRRIIGLLISWSIKYGIIDTS